MRPSPPSDCAGPSIAQARNSRAVATADKLHMNHTAIITEKHPAGPRRLMLVMFVALSFAFTWPTGANAEVPVTSLSTSPMHKPLPLGAPTSERVELLCWGNAELGQTPQQIPHALPMLCLVMEPTGDFRPAMAEPFPQTRKSGQLSPW